MVQLAKNPPANAGGHRRCGFDPWVTKIKLIISLAQMILYLDKSAVSHLKPDIQGVNSQSRRLAPAHVDKGRFHTVGTGWSVCEHSPETEIN